MKPVSGASLSIPAGLVSPKVLRLWVDGGGSVLVCLCDQIRIGRSGGLGELQFMAPLASSHVTLVSTGESHVLIPQRPVFLGGKTIAEPTLLRDGETVQIVPEVQIQFRVPSPLSRTAVLSFPGKIPPTPTIDVAILMNRTCLIGPDSLSHIVVPGIDERGVFVWNGEELSCRFSCEIGENGVGFAWGDAHRVTAGSTISGRQIRFRCESYPEASCSQ